MQEALADNRLDPGRVTRSYARLVTEVLVPSTGLASLRPASFDEAVQPVLSYEQHESVACSEHRVVHEVRHRDGDDRLVAVADRLENLEALRFPRWLGQHPRRFTRVLRPARRDVLDELVEAGRHHHARPNIDIEATRPVWRRP